MYSGKDTNQVTGTLGERVVTKLCASVRNPHVLLSFDRFFTSVNLMQNLQFPAVGTVIKDRKNVPKFTAKLNRGESEFRVSEHGVMAARLHYDLHYWCNNCVSINPIGIYDPIIKYHWDK